MSALAGNRRRALMIGVVGIGVGLFAFVLINVIGWRTIWNSKAGQAAATERYKAEFPYTPTGLIGVVDDDGELVSLAVLCIDPSGVGGKIVVAAPMADASSGTGTTLDPLDRVYLMEGVQPFADQAGLMTRLSFDVIEIMKPERFAALISPLTNLTVDLPISIHDAESKKEWESGPVKATPQQAVEILTASDPDIDDWYYLSARAAVWSGVASAVGSGIAGSSPGAPQAGQPVTTPTSMDELWRRLIAGPVQERTLIPHRVPQAVADDLLNPDLLLPGIPASVVVHDRAEMISVFAAIASSRIGSPNAAARLRIVNPLSAKEVEAAGPGWNVAMMWKLMIDGLLFSGTNVVSIDERPSDAPPEITQVQVVGGELSEQDRDTFTVIFGEFEAVAVDAQIQGIDATIVLGRSFIRHLSQEKLPTFTIGAESTDDSSATSGTTSDTLSATDATSGDNSSTTSGDDRTGRSGNSSDSTSRSSQDSTLSDSSTTASSGTG